MRAGDIILLPDSRLAVVEQSWPGDRPGTKRLEVFAPGATIDGGSLLGIDEAECRWAGSVILHRNLTVSGQRHREMPVRLDRRLLVVAVGSVDMREARRLALWKVLAGRQV